MLAFAYTLIGHRNKFQPRARACVFLGYSPEVKGYKLYDVESKQVFISRDVIFQEEIYPFHTVVKADQLVDPFPDLVLPIPSLTTHQDASHNGPGYIYVSLSEAQQTDSSTPEL